MGEEKALEAYPKFANKMGMLVLADHFPTSEDFLKCAGPWEAVKEYFSEFFRAYERESGMRFEILQDTDTDLQVSVSDCPWDFIWREAGHPELARIHGEDMLEFLSGLMTDLGGDLRKESWLCKGDSRCDWHFCKTGASAKEQ